MVELTRSGSHGRFATADLEQLPEDDARDVRQRLMALADDDVHDFVAIPVPRGPAGAWVVFPVGVWRCVAEWDPGRPQFWQLGAGRGRLVVHRVVAAAALDAAFEETARDSDPD